MLLKPKIALFLLFLLSFGVRAGDLTHPSPGGGCPTSFSKLAKHPALVLLSRGIDAKKLRITQRADRSPYSKAYSRVFDITYDGQDVGTVALNGKDDSLFTTDMFSEMPSLKGKGVGAFVYIAIAKKLYREEKTVLRSSSYLSPEGTALWDRMEEFGFAENTSAGTLFKREFLESTEYDDVMTAVHWK